MELKYDDSELRKLFADMEPTERQKALKNAFKREANNVRKAAIKFLRQSPTKKGSLHVTKEMEKGVKAKTFRKAAGFSVTISTKRGKGKPLDIWFNQGSKNRKTKGRKGSSRSRKSHSTGSIMTSDFMNKAKQETEGSVTDALHEEIRKKFTQIAKKHGCK